MSELDDLIREQARDMRFGNRIYSGHEGTVSIESLQAQGKDIDQDGNIDMWPRLRSPRKRTKSRQWAQRTRPVPVHKPRSKVPLAKRPLGPKKNPKPGSRCKVHDQAVWGRRRKGGAGQAWCGGCDLEYRRKVHGVKRPRRVL